MQVVSSPPCLFFIRTERSKDSAENDGLKSEGGQMSDSHDKNVSKDWSGHKSIHCVDILVAGNRRECLDTEAHVLMNS